MSTANADCIPLDEPGAPMVLQNFYATGLAGNEETTDGDLVNLSRHSCVLLECLSFCGCHQITDRGLNPLLAVVSRLVHLNLCGTMATNALMPNIGRQNNLNYLNFGDTGINDDGLTLLFEESPLLFLQVVNLEGTAITGACWKTGRVLENLKELNLRNCSRFDDEGLKNVVNRFPKLQALWLVGCPKVTQNAMAEFKAERPNCQIIIRDGDIK